MPKQCTLSDEELALLAQDGDEDANTELYYRYRQLVINTFGRTFKCGWIDAEDIFQEAFPNAIRGYRPGKGTFRGFLLQVANNKRIDNLRKAKPQREVSLNEDHDTARSDPKIVALENGIPEDGIPEEPPRAKKIPDPALCQFLETQQRETYHLRYRNRESWKNIADQLGYSSADSARNSLSKALKLAKQKMAQVN
jgi:RNA polymerase sigma factor (sigma-70 family)